MISFKLMFTSQSTDCIKYIIITAVSFVVCFVTVCTGTSFGLRLTGHAGNWSFQRYVRLYKNCVYVDGNLEITYLENGSYDLSFLSTIQEVNKIYADFFVIIIIIA